MKIHCLVCTPSWEREQSPSFKVHRSMSSWYCYMNGKQSSRIMAFITNLVSPSISPTMNELNNKHVKKIITNYFTIESCELILNRYFIKTTFWKLLHPSIWIFTIYLKSVKRRKKTRLTFCNICSMKIAFLKSFCLEIFAIKIRVKREKGFIFEKKELFSAVNVSQHL